MVERKDIERINALLQEQGFNWLDKAKFEEDDRFVYMYLETDENPYNDVISAGDYLPIRSFAIVNRHESYSVSIEKEDPTLSAL